VDLLKIFEQETTRPMPAQAALALASKFSGIPGTTLEATRYSDDTARLAMAVRDTLPTPYGFYVTRSAVVSNITAIASERSGLPLGFTRETGIAPRSSTAAIGVSAHMNIGQGWVTTASFSEGMTQLDPRSNFAGTTLREQSYSVAIAKRGVFGDDALGLAFSRPAPSMVGSLSVLSASGDLPLTVAQGVPLNRAQETDFQLGYVTNFLDGAVALQTNAAYQTNAQGQPGATSVSLLSRAKIKF